MATEVIDLDPIRKDEIAESLKTLRRAVKEMEYLQEYNFSGLYGPDGGELGSSGHIPAKHRLLNLGHKIVKAGADILRCAADLSDD